MKFLSFVLLVISGSWMSIYLYGLHATYDVRYNAGLMIFPILMFGMALYCVLPGLYREYKEAEKKNMES